MECNRVYYHLPNSSSLSSSSANTSRPPEPLAFAFFPAGVQALVRARSEGPTDILLTGGGSDIRRAGVGLVGEESNSSSSSSSVRVADAGNLGGAGKISVGLGANLEGLPFCAVDGKGRSGAERGASFGPLESGGVLNPLVRRLIGLSAFGGPSPDDFEARSGSDLLTGTFARVRRGGTSMMSSNVCCRVFVRGFLAALAGLVGVRGKVAAECGAARGGGGVGVGVGRWKGCCFGVDGPATSSGDTARGREGEMSPKSSGEGVRRRRGGASGAGEGLGESM